MSRFSLYDGHRIHFGPDELLVPDGVIDTPFEGGGGKRATYSMGEIVEEERQY